MKNAIHILVVILLVSSSAFGTQVQDQIDVVSSKQENRTLRGAQVEVLSAEGNRVTVQRLMKRKMIIDFCDVKAGVYTIIVKKDERLEKFEFVRK